MTASAARRIYSAEEVSAMGLSARSAHLLTRGGIPRREAPYFAATALTAFSMRGSRPAAVHRGSLVRVGVWDRASFVVDVISDAVWFVAPDQTGELHGSVPARFVNSHLDTYLECLRRARPMLERGQKDWALHDRSSELNSVRQELRSIDGEAFADPDSYWPVIFWNLTAAPAPPNYADDSTLIESFGKNNRRIYPAAEVQAAGLSGQMASLLATVGMPRRLEPYVVTTNLEPITLGGSALNRLHAEGFVRLGHYGQTDIAVDRRRGAVWQIYSDVDEPAFVNSNLRAYVGCVCHIWWAVDRGMPGLPVPAARGLLERLRREVRMMDEQSLGDECTYWSVVFEELGYEVG